MSKTVYRQDRGGHGALRSPVVTSQGFLRVDGHAARVGIYEYPRADGSIQYELRPREEVFHPDSLASYDAAPVTLDHPVDGEVNAENVRRHEIGTVSGVAREDGDAVAVHLVIKDAKAIKAVRAGKQELSPGYKIRLDETPGFAPEYATPRNPTGRYHAVQRDVRVNHQAIVGAARGGSTMRIRMDAMEGVLMRADAGSDAARADAGGGNPNHDGNGRFSSGGGGGSHAHVASAAAHSASAAATTAEGHQHAARLHEQAAASHQAAGNGALAQSHTLIAQHHQGAAAEAGSGHTGPGHEHSERAMAATDKAYRASPADHAKANRAAADAHDTAAAVHSKEGHAGAAAEHQRLADQHRSVVGSDARIRPGMMSSGEAHPPASPRQRYEPPKVSAEAKAASKAATDAKYSMGSAPTPADHHRVAKLFDAAAAEHHKSGDSGEAVSHEKMAQAHRDAAAGVKKPTKYRGDEDLTAAARHRLPGSMFAVPEHEGLPIQDEEHVRAAMSRFGQEKWADASQEKTAYHKILSRAKTLGIDAAGFKDKYGGRLDSGGKLTTVAAGHQHLVDMCGWDGQQRSSGETSYALAEGADVAHSHPWAMGMDGTITIGEAAGHVHAVIDAASAPMSAGYYAPTASSSM